MRARMSEFVLDASALLALLNEEEGAELVQECLPQAIISTVNLAEVVTRLAAIGMPEAEIRETLGILGLEVIPLDEEQAFQIGLIYPKTKSLGLSLGDRACLTLAGARGVPAVTADRAWGKLPDLGTSIKLVRNE
jgi:ribonuclease VapC